MNSNKSFFGLDNILILVVLAFSILPILAILVWAGPCSGVLDLANGNATPMRCFYTSKVIMLIAIVMVLVSVKSFVSGSVEGVALFLLACAMIVVTLESPVGIGVCKSEMACWDMAFWVRLSGAVAAAASLAIVLRPVLSKQVD